MIQKKCRICSSQLLRVSDFSKVALSGSFLTFKQIKKERKYQLTLMVCRVCKHIQIQNILNTNILFKNYYAWETGISKTNMDLIRDLLTYMKKKFLFNQKSKFLEIASNDGSLLKEVKKKHKSMVLGIDPAKNLKAISTKNNVPTIVDFFSSRVSKKIRKKYQTFDFCIARNVIAHTPNPNDIFKGVKNILKAKGIFVIEVPHLYNIHKDNQYDNIFHEHIGFHSLKSIDDLCKKNDLKLFDINLINSQGGSLQCFICKKNNKIMISKKINKILKKEIKQGLFKLQTWYIFAKRIKNHSIKLKTFLVKLKRKNFSIHIYGASGKGQSLMQICKIDKTLIDFVYDKSKFKQNKYTPGTHVKIINPKYIKKYKPNYLLLLSWNLSKEIIMQEKNYFEKYGKAIVPFPKPHIVRIKIKK